ncbi:hypothetical protein [Sorangium sp. So ce1024]|uniref:hypothetical protein n=1 Tax=Sorangium sp. So ce1024 TaxID=3133327 RepID=UPI003EFFE6FE
MATQPPGGALVVDHREDHARDRRDLHAEAPVHGRLELGETLHLPAGHGPRRRRELRLALCQHVVDDAASVAHARLPARAPAGPRITEHPSPRGIGAMKLATWLVEALIDTVSLFCDLHDLWVLVAAILSGGAVAWLPLLWLVVVAVHGAVGLYGTWKSRPRLR